ncbi:isochorismatase family protein [Polynucleobacter sp. AP-Capit-er-40B-B4]|uniref:isochorismatase family protein n=1 Tax=Polynucleobacter sp. AP-Capit-er-40B-B4 TaxID=2576927 RepID=UPI001C0E5E7C|nr:isochorismatase family protein [Polynucleobacter sp. AP-Capit-er-40B-B4]MBU3581484.1 isochorismatase family protein [Polynucleobacter sp. AP-Capit-er-40B-B4]
MVKITPNRSSLVLIDLQSRLMPSIHQGEEVLKQCIKISKIARLLDIPIIATEQSPQSLGHNVDAITQFCEATVAKDHFDACQDGLINALSKNREHLILAGCETHVCVMQTALELVRQNFKVSILVDAVGSRRSLDRDIALHRLGSSGATLLTVEMMAFEWLGTASNECFKDALEIIKS